MSFDIPTSMEELVYFTNRKFDKGKVICWVYREDCPKCGKVKMTKPQADDGHIQIRAKFYECQACHNKVDKNEYEDSLEAFIIYSCPHCSYEAEQKVPFRRKKVKGVEALVFHCQKCNGKIYVSKKMKEIK
jgi:ssDNA-binding Zn-finger/Zn-ribbon topoisomerase 1